MILSADELDDFPGAPSPGQPMFHLGLDGAYVYAPGATGALASGWLRVASGAVLREGERARDRLVRAQYAGRDYQTFLDEIMAHVKSRYGDRFNDFTASAPGQMLIRFISAALDTLSWNLDQRASEGYLFLAALRSSIAQWARALGYKPRVGVAASIALDLILPAGPYAFDVPVKAGFQFTGPNGLVFEQATSIVIPAGATSIAAVPYFQGETVNETFSSNGAQNQVFRLRRVGPDRFVGKDTVRVYVAAALWTEADFLPFAAEDQFEVSYDTDPAFVRTGDGVVGAIPADGSEVRVVYVATKGRAGNSVPQNSVTQPRSALVANFTDIPIRAAHTGTSGGGEHPEDARSVQANAPRVWSAAGRAVTQEDWDALLNTYSDAMAGAVARGRAHVVRGIATELTLQGLLAAIRTAGQAAAALAVIAAANELIRTKVTAALALKETAVAALDLADGSIGAVATALGAIKVSSAAARTALEALHGDLGSLSFQENIGLTDGTSATFTGSLSKAPVVPGTVAVMLESMAVAATSTSGNVDAVPGEVQVSPGIFLAAMVGRLIKIGADFRRVRKFVSTTSVEYSGPKLSGTSLKVTVYAPAVVAYDDAAGGLAGTGVSTGVVDYTTGAISVTFATVPEGASTVGRPVQVAYRYEATGLRQQVTDVSDALVADVEAEATAAEAVVLVAQGQQGDAGDALDALVTILAEIAAQADASDVGKTTAAQVGTEVSLAVGDLETYLDKVLSGDCKANIVQLRVLVHDGNGDFAAPSQLLLSNVKSYFDGKKLITVTVSPVSGIRDVVLANITIKLEVEEPYVYKNVQPIAEAAVVAALKDRYYGVPLKESDLRKLIVRGADDSGGVAGVKSAVIRITGSSYKDPSVSDPPIAPNANGDLIVGSGQVIAKGVLSWQELVY